MSGMDSRWSRIKNAAGHWDGIETRQRRHVLMMSLFSPFFRHTFYSSLLFTAEPFIAAAVVFHVPRIKGRGKSSSPVIGNTDTAVIDNPPRIICKTYFFLLLLHLGVRRAGGKALGSDRFFWIFFRTIGGTFRRRPLAPGCLGCCWAVNFILDEKLTSPTDVRAYLRLVFREAVLK